MDSKKIITTLAMLKTRSDSGMDYIEIFVPFIVHLIKIKNYQELEISIIAEDFKSEYGLIIPYYGIKTILRRCKTRGYVIKDNYKYFANKEKILSDDFSVESNEQKNKIDQTINDFNQYVVDNFPEKKFLKQDCELLLLSFVRDHSSDIVYSSENISTIPKIDVDKQNYYIVCKYIEHLITKNLTIFGYLLDFSIGQSLADIIICEDFNNYNYNLSNLNCYLDSGIIFYLLGTGGDKKQEVYQELINSIKGCGGKLFVFRHTYEEISIILGSCVKWIDNPALNLDRANRTILFFLENGYHKSDAEMFVAKLDTVLKNNDINIVEKPSYETETTFQIDEKSLRDEMQKIYQERGGWGKNDLVNPETLDRDIKSIYSIYKLRKGSQPKTLKDAKHIFVTTGKSFAYAVSMFEEKFLEKFTIKSCVTDEFISTIIWVHSPQKYKEINKKKIVSDVYAALKPTKALLKQYLYQIDLLKKEKNLSEEQYFVLRGNKTSIDLLSEKTLTDPDNFSTKTIGEILMDEQQKAREEYINEANNHRKTKEELGEKTFKIEKMECRLKRISMGISFVPAVLVAIGLLLPIFFSSNWILKISCICAFLLNVWGLGITSLRKKIEDYIFIKFKKLIE